MESPYFYSLNDVLLTYNKLHIFKMGNNKFLHKYPPAPHKDALVNSRSHIYSSGLKIMLGPS
jgi:hypothetical protein